MDIFKVTPAGSQSLESAISRKGGVDPAPGSGGGEDFSRSLDETCEAMELPSGSKERAVMSSAGGEPGFEDGIEGLSDPVGDVLPQREASLEGAVSGADEGGSPVDGQLEEGELESLSLSQVRKYVQSISSGSEGGTGRRPVEEFQPLKISAQALKSCRKGLTEKKIPAGTTADQGEEKGESSDSLSPLSGGNEPSAGWPEGSRPAPVSGDPALDLSSAAVSGETAPTESTEVPFRTGEGSSGKIGLAAIPAGPVSSGDGAASVLTGGPDLFSASTAVPFVHEQSTDGCSSPADGRDVPVQPEPLPGDGRLGAFLSALPGRNFGGNGPGEATLPDRVSSGESVSSSLAVQAALGEDLADPGIRDVPERDGDLRLFREEPLSGQGEEAPGLRRSGLDAASGTAERGGQSLKGGSAFSSVPSPESGQGDPVPHASPVTRIRNAGFELSSGVSDDIAWDEGGHAGSLSAGTVAVPEQTAAEFGSGEVLLQSRGAEALARGLAETIHVIRRKGGHRGTVEVSPPDLGKVRITVDSSGDGVQVHLRVDSAQARDMLQQTSDVLREALERQGLNLTGMSVDVGQQDGNHHGTAGSGTFREGAASDTYGGVPEFLDVEDEEVLTRLDLERGILNWVA